MSGFVPTAASYRPGDRTLPGEYYTSPEVLARDLDRIHARSWLCAGRSTELTEAGQYLVRGVGPDSAILIRGKDGSVRGFHNVCRHRGTRLLDAERGTVSGTIQCPYHAWTYDLEGRLRGAPHMQDVPDFDPSGHSLHPVEVEEWEGFLFFRLVPGGEPLGAQYGQMTERVARFRLGGLRPARRIGYEVRANWKLVLQNFSECLHCPVIHPALSRLSPYLSGANDLTEGPILGGYLTLADGVGSMTLSGRTCARPVGELPDEDHARGYYYSLFPNLLLSLHPDYVMYHLVWPVAPDRTRIECEWLFHPDASADDSFQPDEAVGFWDMTNRQDWHICEQSQAGVASRAYRPGPYSPRESLLAAWDRAYLAALGGSEPQG